MILLRPKKSGGILDPGVPHVEAVPVPPPRRFPRRQPLARHALLLAVGGKHEGSVLPRPDHARLALEEGLQKLLVADDVVVVGHAHRLHPVAAVADRVVGGGGGDVLPARVARRRIGDALQFREGFRGRLGPRRVGRRKNGR
uniref:Uncharacterized protein n=1 Tax=Corethron hystrix TaxID=216773 RepID=A0A7S1G054_9STRA